MTTRSARVILEKMVGPVTFAMFVRAARSSMGLTQVDFAKKLKVTPATLCDIEKGRQMVSVALAAKIAKTAGLSVEQAIAASVRDQLRKAKLNYEVRIA